MAEIKTEPLTDYYDVKEELGRGRFAVVKRCIQISTGGVFAAKCIRKARAGRRGREQLLLEIDILYRSNHPKLVKLYDVFETRSEMILILEYAAGGDLHKHCLEQMDSVRTEKEICSLIYQIVEAGVYLHENSVVHLDLKPENILLKNDQRFPEIRLIDFGLSRRVDLPYSQYDIVGTPEYVAPEVLSYEPIELSADLWSIGVVTYVLLSGISPFAGDDIMETYSNISNVDFDFDAEEFDDISEEAKDFVECLLIKDPKERLKIKECLEHPWLKQMEKGVKEEDIFAAIKAEKAFNSFTMQDCVSDAEESDEGSVFSSENDAVEEIEDVASGQPSEEVKNEDSNELRDDNIFEMKQNLKEYEKDDNPSEVAIKDEAEPENKPALNSEITVDNENTNRNEDSVTKIDVSRSEEQPLKNPSFGLFDIDSLISKDEDENTGTASFNDEETTSENPCEVEVEDIMPSKANEINESEKLCTEESNDVSSDSSIEVKKVDSSTVDSLVTRTSDGVAADTKNKVDNDSSPDTSIILNKTENESNDVQSLNNNHKQNGSVKGSYKKQRSSDAALQQNSSVEEDIDNVKSDYTTTKESRLVKMKSVDENMLAGRIKNNDGNKNKLGAHLEKLSKAGLNFTSENDIRKPGPAIVRQGSTRKENMTEKIVFDAITNSSMKDVSNKEKQRKTSSQSSRSSGSCTPSSGRGTPDSGTGTPISLPQAAPSAASKDVKIVPLAKQTEEKSNYGKRTPASKTPLGVRQGIAAQMASKFANAEKMESQANTAPQHRISNKKLFEYQCPGTKSPENIASRSPQMSPVINRAKKFANASTANNDERKPAKNSPKFERANNFSDLQKKVQNAGERKAANESSMKDKVSSTTKHHSNDATFRKEENQVDGGLKKAKSKENIIQKFERKIKNESDQGESAHQVIVQPKGLQINFNLQASNKFRAKQVDVPIQRDPSPNKWDAKLSKEKPLKFKIGNNEKQEVVTVSAPYGSILEQNQDFDHVEHTAIGAIATVPRTPLRELRGKSRTSRDRGDGSPSGSRKSYRRLYVTHVKGSKSEQETDMSEDIAEFKTKVEKDELKVELLVKFPDMKFGTL